jgi:hypothetical protein
MELYKTCRDGSEQPSDAALVICLKAMVELPGRLPIFIIIDALDECQNTAGTPSARDEVLDFVTSKVQDAMEQLFDTSKPYLPHGFGYMMWIGVAFAYPSTLFQTTRLLRVPLQHRVLCHVMWPQWADGVSDLLTW